MMAPMRTITLILASTLLSEPALYAQATQSRFTQMFTVRREEFFKHTPQDACSELVRRVEKKEIKLDTASRLSLTKDLLKALNVPVSSQLLVFSGTASQGSRVNSKNPRALYFNDEVYVGMVPGGFVEMIGIDPQFGPVWYSIEKFSPGDPPVALRQTDCFRCHNTGNGVPGMFTRYVIPNESGNGFDDFQNIGTDGHQLTFATRFAGYHVTSAAPLSYSREGFITLSERGKPVMKHIKPGERYDPKLHLSTTSDVVAHLVHAHQVGFVNLAAQIGVYAMDGRTNSPDRAEPTEERLSPMVDKLVRYMLFSDEAPLPEGGVTGHPDYLRDFAANRKPCKLGPSLKDFDLRTRMFKYRCSYMIYTRQFQEMAPKAKALAYGKLKAALWGQDPFFAYLPEHERAAIVTILRDTLPDLPREWGGLDGPRFQAASTGAAKPTAR